MLFSPRVLQWGCRSIVTCFVATTLLGCSKKQEDATPAVTPIVSFSVRFDSYGPDSWSRNYTEAECSTVPSEDLQHDSFLSFRASTLSGDEVWTVDVYGISRSEVLAGVVGTYDGDGVFATEMRSRARGNTGHIPAIAYTNRHGTPYTFTISSYDAATKRASGTFDLNLGNQYNPLNSQQGYGVVWVKGQFKTWCCLTEPC